ncbi:hypothetical protein ETAA8_24070 [Anatilimnocola aggregata]|uniref:DUF1501 domain-containing protein n=1 Tax=Anatilimnocola aggregata TaxID=2528021 RepID=A0A517YAR2_9BACT|nr:DUF1501 domain-containing protein [Anatilimnocola aggregata]QDU27320.1 hypothetical protein ETAA8_24070 [Anatilimnocola aggregata]
MYPCQRVRSTCHSRRDFLQQSAAGFGAFAMSALLAGGELPSALAAEAAKDLGPFAPRQTHFAGKAKSVIYLYMDGGPSQVDTFDPKPRLTAEDGQPFGLKMEPTQFNNNGATLGSPWKFNNYGESGLPVSDLFPNVGQHADKLAVIHSMTSEFPEHTSANYFLHTGTGVQGRPSMGAWFNYGLGSECRDLPGFVVINGGLIPPGGLDNFNSGFLPATYQGSIFAAQQPPVSNIQRLEATDTLQKNKLALLKRLDEQLLAREGRADALESAIANYELAYRMQTVVPELMDLKDETVATQSMYGLDAKYAPTQTFGRQCLLARRLVEKGVRFIELTCPGLGHDRWDQHANLVKGHEDNSRCVDQPIAALLTDLAQRGLLESTLVVWSGEFGRTPFAQGKNGRDHNPFGFSLWMAGGGIKGGTTYGATDEYGYKAVENVCEIHDLHATMFHLLGMDHTRVTFRFAGRDMRLTDVKGHVLKDIIA